MTRRLRLAFGVACAAAFAAGFGVTSPPVAGLGVTGAQQTPHRIISLVPSVTEMIYAIGAGKSLVGVSIYDRFPRDVESLPRVGALLDPDFERIIALTPDLVVVYGTQNDLIARLDRVRIPVFRYEHAGLADITTTIRQLGERLDRVAEAKQETDRIERELNAVRRLVAGKPRPKTLLILGRELGSLRGILASGGVGFLSDLLDVAGGVNVYADVKRQSLQATAETLIARGPEVILELYSSEGWTPARIALETAVWRGLPTLPAVRDGRVHILPNEALLGPGPRVTETARILAAVLH
jgi:iron complex transport system substrate-binding protein